MNILFITQNYLPRIGGITRHVRELTEELLADSHSVNILVTNGEGNALFESEGKKSIYRLKKKYGRAGIVFQMFRLFRLFKQADVIHFHDFFIFWKYGIVLLPVLKLLGKEVYLTFHGWEGKFPPEKKIVLKRKVCAYLADGNMCIGHYIEKWYGTKADVISYGGVKRAKDLTGMKKDVVFVGRLSEDTGIREYVKAWKEINSEFPDLKLIICGDGPLRGALEEFIRQENILNIDFKGFVREPDHFIKNAAIVFTSGYLGILEAASYGKAIISVYENKFKKDILEIIPGSRDMLWIASRPDEIAASIREALRDTEKSANAYRFSIENSWERVKKDYYRLWNISERSSRVEA